MIWLITCLITLKKLSAICNTQREKSSSIKEELFYWPFFLLAIIFYIISFVFDMSVKISLCLIIKNEEKNLDICLSSVVEYVDEIIITDTWSSDNSIQIAHKYTDKIYHFKWESDFSAARNYCQSYATWDYILWMDADEWFEKNDIELLIKRIHENLKEDFFAIARHNVVNKKVTKKETQVKVIKNSSKYQWKWKSHEIIDTIQKDNTLWTAVTCFDIKLFHNLSTQKKYWCDIEYFIENYHNDKENNTISIALVNHFLSKNNQVKVNFFLKEIPSIDTRFLENFLLIRRNIEEKWYWEEKKILNQLILKHIKENDIKKTK